MGNTQVIYNVLAKDLENAKELFEFAKERVLIGLMVKDFPTEEEAIKTATKYKEAGIPISIGLGAGNPSVWKKVVNVSASVMPNHINQVFPAAGYTLGAIKQSKASDTIVNALIEPSGRPGEVYISTGPKSKHYRETVSCEMAAALLAETGIHSVKFYPIEGDTRLDEVAAMAKAAVASGIKIFEPTGGINLHNVKTIVQTCFDQGCETVIPHLYTSLIDKETGKTKVETMKNLITMKYNC